MIFYDAQGNPIDIDVVRYQGLIPGGLAKRVTSKVDGGVQKLTTAPSSMASRKPKWRIRVLDFEVAK